MLVVYRTIPTSNHNLTGILVYIAPVVYRTIPTSNHNYSISENLISQLYIVLFLHQTTTRTMFDIRIICCISYYSYIKPQPYALQRYKEVRCISYYSYIKPQLIISV